MKRLFWLPIVMALLLTACTKDGTEPPFSMDVLSGEVQKGPFLSGTSVDIYELGINYTQTGKSYSSQIENNTGIFALHNVSFITSYALLKAEGNYFNEIRNQNSTSAIILYAMVSLKDKEQVNVNVLSNLQKGRMEQLLSEGVGYAEANEQSKAEILDIFSITKPDIMDFETLDISKNGDDNAILLAVSLIVQGFRTEQELTQLMADISADISSNGVLDNVSLGTLLINDTHQFDLPQIRSNMEQKFQDLGMSSFTVPNFEKYVQQFIENTDFPITNL